MKQIRRASIFRVSTLVTCLPMFSMAAMSPAIAQRASISLPTQPLAEALKKISATSGTRIHYDPDAVHDLNSMPVKDASNAKAAVRQAIASTGLVMTRQSDGSISVTSDITVVARRDEAETKVLVRSATTSTRTGQTLREQPRNTQIISSKLMEDQQAQTLVEALRNAGGVSVNTASVQGGATYTVRGFSAGGIVNGLPGGSNGSFSAGVTQPIANIERLEVLKGPDALLAGANSLGGTVNIVTKKPHAETRLYISGETGSYGQIGGTIDANTALNGDRTVSARIIATSAKADHNFGGYKSDEDYVYAPSLRFKNTNTDVVVGLTLSNQIFGATPYVALNPTTKEMFDFPRNRPLLQSADQGIQIKSTVAYGEVTHKVANWLTLVARGQHEQLSLEFAQYSPLAVLNSAGDLLVSNERGRQTGNADAFDAYARFTVKALGIDHSLTAGYTYVENDMDSFSSSKSTVVVYNIFTATAPPPVIPAIDVQNFARHGTQNGYYGQYMMKFWKLSLLAGLRHNIYESTLTTFKPALTTTDRGSATVPNFGAVFDLSPDITLFGALSYGYTPVFSVDRNLQKLPDTRSRNAEAGVKVDLFRDRMLINASVFQIRQSNLIITDPTNSRYRIAAPGRQGTGIDLNVSGQINQEWSVQASYTRTNYKPLTLSSSGNIVPAQPRDQYSLYTSYRHRFDDNLTAGLGGGVFGRSSASVDRRGSYYVPAAVQLDLNSFLKIGALDVNLGVRNVLNRRNFGITFADSYIPISEPRNWRLTVGYQFK